MCLFHGHVRGTLLQVSGYFTDLTIHFPTQCPFICPLPLTSSQANRLLNAILVVPSSVSKISNLLEEVTYGRQVGRACLSGVSFLWTPGPQVHGEESGEKHHADAGS